jgi:hypothetical protein
MGRHVVRMAKKKNEYRILVGKPEGKRPLGRYKHRWEYNMRESPYIDYILI